MLGLTWLAEKVLSGMKTKLLLIRKVKLAFGSAIIMLFVVGALSLRSLAASGESDRWLRHTHEVVENIQDLLAGMQTLESSMRGYVLTGRDSYLESYQAGINRVLYDQKILRDLTADNASQQTRLNAIAEVAARKIQLADRVGSLRKTAGLEAAVNAVQSGQGQQIMDEFQDHIRNLRGEELRLLAFREADAKRRLGQTRLILIFGVSLGLLIASAAGWTVFRDTAQRAQAEEALRDSEERYRMLIQGARDYSIVMLDPQGEICSWNLGAERMTGCSSEEAVGRNFSTFYTAADVKRGWPRELLGRSAANGVYEEQGTRVRKDGTRFTIRTTYTALRDAAGSLRGFSAIGKDLSESAESGAKYRGLMEAAPDAMVVVDETGDIVLLNVQAEKRFGYSRDELLGQKVANIIPQGFAERLIADGSRTAPEALAQQMGTGIELTGRRKDGSEFPIEIMLSPLESDGGTLVTAAIRDITTRKEAEAHLVRMEGRYRGLLEAAPDAMVVVNQAGEIVLLNVQAERQFRYSRDELLGQKMTNIIPEGFAERLVADALRSAEEALAQQIGTGIELDGRRKDGSEFPIEIMLSPLESPEGMLVTAAIRDISVRRAAEEHLVQMEGRYRGLLEAAPDAMVVVNQAGNIVLLNAQAEKQFGYSRNALLGQKVVNIIPEGFAERLIADALRSSEDALAQRIGTGIELTARRRNGSKFPIEIMLSPLESAEGLLVTAAIRDISTRKDAEAHLLKNMAELNRSNEELVQFAYIASHDLQEPLRMVASYTQLLAKRYKGKLDSDADEFIAFAVDGANRMQRLIQDLLTYSRAGTQAEALIETSSEDALRQSLINLRGVMEASGAQVTYDPLPEVRADGRQLVQLFQNLIGNAIKYQGPGVPQVHVSAVRNGGRTWVFSVKDNGLGIDSKYFDKIFGMFQRLHKREEFAGTGIGLAICKKIVQRHGGKISVESQPGQGSTFRFVLAEGEGNA